MANQSTQDIAVVFIELGAAIVGLAFLARIASRWGFSAIPLYLIAGLCFGNGGIAPLDVSESFIHISGEIGVLLLLFMLGLEYTGEELKRNLQTSLPAGLVDLGLNFPPGFILGLVLGWHPLAALLLGGVTYISSSGVIARVLEELGRLENKETKTILSILVMEDLAMAIYLPLVAALLLGGSTQKIALSITVAIVTVSIVLTVAVRYGRKLSRLAAHGSDEIILLTTFGTVLLVAGLAQKLQVSSAIGAFLVGIAASDSLAEQSHRVLSPLRDLFAATFFFVFGLQIDPGSLPAAAPYAIGLGLVTAGTKIATGYWSAKRSGNDKRGALRAGMGLIARGEFSIVIAGLGSGLEPQLGPLSAAYVLFLAVLGPILARSAK